jgi:hypothetical protein
MTHYVSMGKIEGILFIQILRQYIENVKNKNLGILYI